MSFWKQNQAQLKLQWDMHRRQIDRQVAEHRRDLVRRNLRQSNEWLSYEQYADWYLEREVEAFVLAVDEVSSAARIEIDDDSLNEMDRMLSDLIDSRRQLASAEALRALGSDEARLKGLARVGLLRVQSARRSEPDRSTLAPPPIRRPARDSAAATAAARPPQPTAPVSEASGGEIDPFSPSDPRAVAQNLRRLAQLVQQLPDAEEQVETLEELQFIAEEAAAEPDRRKLRMVGAALDRIRTRISRADPGNAPNAKSLADPIRRWFEVTA